MKIGIKMASCDCPSIFSIDIFCPMLLYDLYPIFPIIYLHDSVKKAALCLLQDGAVWGRPLLQPQYPQQHVYDLCAGQEMVAIGRPLWGLDEAHLQYSSAQPRRPQSQQLIQCQLIQWLECRRRRNHLQLVQSQGCLWLHLIQSATTPSLRQTVHSNFPNGFPQGSHSWYGPWVSNEVQDIRTADDYWRSSISSPLAYFL